MGFSKNWIYFCLVILILLGVFLRVDSISSNYLLPDEPHIMTSALKFHHEGFLEGATYSADHPPLAKWVMGLSTISSESDFSVLVFVKMGMRVYSLLSIEPIKQNYVSMLYISLLMGVLFLVFVFLLTWKIFNLDSALWATALVSLSAQLITYSRHVFFENYFLAFLVIGLFFYYLFLNKEDSIQEKVFLIISLIFLTLAMGSRTLFPLLIPPAFIFSVWFSGKSFKIKSVFSALILILFYWSNFILWPEAARQFTMGSHYQFGGDILSLFAFNYDIAIGTLIYQHSYAFLFSLLILVWFIFSKKKVWAPKVKEIRDQVLVNNYLGIFNLVKKYNVIFLLSLFFILSFVGFGGFFRFVSRFGIVFVLPLAIFAGYAVSLQSKKVRIIMLLLLLFSVFLFFPKNFAPFSNPQAEFYSNFGNHPGYVTFEEGKLLILQNIFEYFDELGNPPILSNDFNVLLYYQGDSEFWYPPIAEFGCTGERISLLKESNAHVVFIRDLSPGYKHGFFCPYMSDLKHISFSVDGSKFVEGRLS